MLSKRSVVTNLKKNIEVFMKEELAQFNTLYDNIEYTKIAFCFDQVHGSFSFSINTRFDENKAVLIYSGTDSDFVISNPKHWRYQDIGIIDLIETEHFEAYFGQNVDELYDIMTIELKKFMNSHVYKGLKRSKDFVATFVVEEPFQCFVL